MAKKRKHAKNSKKKETQKQKVEEKEEKKEEKEIKGKFDLAAETATIQHEEVSIEQFVGAAEKALGVAVTRKEPAEATTPTTEIRGEGQEAAYSSTAEGPSYGAATEYTAESYQSTYRSGTEVVRPEAGGLEQIGTGARRQRREVMEPSLIPEAERIPERAPGDELFLNPIGETQYKKQEELEKKRVRKQKEH